MWLPGDRRGTPTSGRYDGVPVPGERHQKHWRQRRQRQQHERQQQQQQQQPKLPGSPAEAGRAQFRPSEAVERRDERGGVHPRARKLPHAGGQAERSGERGPQQVGVGSEQRRGRDEGARHKVERWRRLPRSGHRVAAVQRSGSDLRRGAVERAELRQGEGRCARLAVRPAPRGSQP